MPNRSAITSRVERVDRSVEGTHPFAGRCHDEAQFVEVAFTLDGDTIVEVRVYLDSTLVYPTD